MMTPSNKSSGPGKLSPFLDQSGRQQQSNQSHQLTHQSLPREQLLVQPQLQVSGVPSATGGGTAMVDKDSAEYRRLRERNNQAVKKSRTKSRIKAQQAHERVARLRQENDELTRRIDSLQSQLAVYKELFLKQAGARGEQELLELDFSFLHNHDDAGSLQHHDDADDDDTVENHHHYYYQNHQTQQAQQHDSPSQ